MFNGIQQYLDERKQRRERARADREQFEAETQAHQQQVEAFMDVRRDEIRKLTIDEARIQTFELLDNTDLFEVKPALGQSIPLEDQLPPSIRELFSKYSSIGDPWGTFLIGVGSIERLKRTPPFIRIGSDELGEVAVKPGDERIYVIYRQKPLNADGSDRHVYEFLLRFAAWQDAESIN